MARVTMAKGTFYKHDNELKTHTTKRLFEISDARASILQR